MPIVIRALMLTALSSPCAMAMMTSPLWIWPQVAAGEPGKARLERRAPRPLAGQPSGAEYLGDRG